MPDPDQSPNPNVAGNEKKEPTTDETMAQVGQALVENFPTLIPALAKVHAERAEAIREYNQVQSRLWGRAMNFEAILIGMVILGGFGASGWLAYIGQIQSAEKIAFALFGFIGGRGFLHIRGLIESSKRN